VTRDGWRFNDKRCPILYASEVQSLALQLQQGSVVVRQLQTAPQGTEGGVFQPGGSAGAWDCVFGGSVGLLGVGTGYWLGQSHC